MNINIRLNKNFTTQLNKLDQEYGEEFRRLQGLDDDKLSFTDFIDNFIDTDTVADDRFRRVGAGGDASHHAKRSHFYQS